MATYLVANSFLGLGIEGTRGVASSTMKWIPVTNPQVTPTQVFLRDEAMRGSATMVYDQIVGVRHDEYDAKGYLYVDTLPILLRSILGGTDVVTGTTTYTHTIGLLNDTSGSQPPSLTIQDFDGANAFQMLGSQASSWALSFGAEAAAEWTVKLTGNPYTTITTPSPSFSAATAASMIPGWDVTVSIAGTPINYVVEGEIRIERNAAPIFTMGTQAPRVNFASPAEISGRLLCVVDSTSDIFSTGGTAYGLYRNPVALVVTLTDPVTTYTTTFTMTKVQFQNVRRQRGKAYVEVEIDFTANANTTDSGGTGYSPIKTATTNAISTAF